MGWKRSHLLLQKAIASAGGDVSEDGWLGPNTVSEARRVDNKALVREFGIQAATFYANIAVNDTSQTKFLEGWMYRAFREVLDAIEDIHTNES
jgi:lysozyme family protein